MRSPFERSFSPFGSEVVAGNIPVVTSETWALSGHSYGDTLQGRRPEGNALRDMAGVDGITLNEFFVTGAWQTAQYRYDRSQSNDAGAIGPPHLIDELRDPANEFTYLVNMEGMDDPGGLEGITNGSPSFADTGALAWHTEATTAGVDTHFYIRWGGYSAEYGGFNQSWRNAISNEEWARWDGMKSYVDANKAHGSPSFEFVYLDAAVAVLFDRIQDGTYTQFSIGDFFSDTVHMDTNLGRWLVYVFVWSSIRGTDPNVYPLQLGAMTAPITAGQKAELFNLVVDVQADPSLAILPAGPATAPAALTVSDWTLETSATSGAVDLTITTAPDDGGSPITGYQYTTAGADSHWVDIPSAGASYSVGETAQITHHSWDPSFPIGTGNNVGILVRAVNAIGNGPLSDGKGAATGM
ncbi:hypothetical protein GCM10007385_35670 [Tateyamaria omphalii]|uniref:hypothetical protein n=1 Tax=Tateyamaria omphalii TaxID=299262 RepID=UPI001672D146|nr:hypothetical protein [Tateyamaria omphalii]GGX63398.1 hypothetical protein GCM10007385_35670 [Tateyamaria omphalii]